MKNSKGQIFLPDFVSSVVIFSFILFFFMLGWNTLVDSNFSGERQDIVLNAERSQKILLETEGYPHDWNTSNVVVPGLKQSGYVSPQKFVYLKNTDKSERNRMLKNAFYNLTFRQNGSIASFNGTSLTLGSEIQQSDDLVVLRENVLVNKSGSIETMEAVYYEWR